MSTPQKQAATEFLKLVATGKVREAFAKHAAPGFRHHNAWFPGDADSLMRGMEDNAKQNPGKALEVKGVIEEGDRVAVMSHMRHNASEPGFALVHTFRFENGRIAELWDLAQQIPATSPNRNGMF
jgi:predicted SnoaL-like aldol condensation-catalyzing enzyme